MPKTPKTALKQAALPLAVHASGDPWQPSSDEVATVPLPNDVIITSIEGAYTAVSYTHLTLPTNREV